MGDDINVSVNGTKTRQRRKVAHFVTHPEFSRDTFQNDIAVIRVRNCLLFVVVHKQQLNLFIFQP